MDLFLLSMPWLAVGLFMALCFRTPRGLPPGAPWGEGEAPFVSIIVPARNEEANIGECVSSLAALDYPAFEVLVVDDESSDRTAEIVEGLSNGSASELRLIRGRPLADGWFGKPWACWQGAEQARGELLLFTDADTTHAPGLLSQAVRGLREGEADVLTLLGRQVMGSFWEQLLQPQFFMLLAARFPRVGTPQKPHQWRHAIANGQYLLFRRAVYEALGGHRAVAGEVVEDMRLAQLLVRGGWKLAVRATEGLQTRMYRSLGDLVEGWSKNVATAALQSTAPWLLPIIMPLSMLVGVTLWLLPPALLTWALVTGNQGVPLAWGVVTTGLGVWIWVRASVLMKGNPLYGLIFPLGSLLGGYIFLKSWWRGTRIQWKGRTYLLPQGVRTYPPAPRGS
ncbi:MAG: glycosyltransferase [Longimicrobiales bacterium]|nr:glycosyltransferase [Longimicrobiales bacterium]